ncbi:hypothetical protein [Actinoallomurus sp. NPDC052274]|uniref:hypothetical protein n=1 Tax=Actinoallomurus sp. NPDC052274 TaxID=3155420 RepID=UPI00343FF4BC
MVFDERRYVREVLEPARAAGDQPPDDLRLRYALPDPLVAREVADRVKRVRTCWRKARGQLRFRRLVDRLEGEHLRLAPLFERAAAGDLAPLRAEIAAAGDRAGHRRAELRDRLLDAAGDLRMLSPADLREIGGEAADVARAAGLEIREPDPLPAAPPYAGYARARDALDALGMRHLREFLTGEPHAGRVLGGTPDLRPAAQRVGEQWSRRPHDGNRTNADTVLVAVRQVGARLAELVRYDIVARLRERHQQRASEGALLRYAADELGVDRDDARRLVFAIRRETAPTGGLTARLRDLIDAGEVQAAAELAELAGEPAGDGRALADDARVLADEARRRVAAATALRQEAASLLLSDPDGAWLRLADALRLVGDLPGAAELQAGLPPQAPGRLEAAVDGAAVALCWSPSSSRVGEIGYVVLRCLGRVPRHPGDGERLAAEAAHARDPAPPLNAPVYYAVFAVRGSAASAPAVAGPVLVRPEPADVTVTAADGVVAARWSCPPEAIRVIVTRDGTPVPAARTGFRDETVRNGTTYHYRIAAAYLGADGGETVTAGVHAAATPAARPGPVTGFDVEHDPAGRLAVTFEPPADGEVELVAMDRPPPWPPGTTLPLEDVRRVGRVLRAVPAPGGLTVETGPGVLLAVSVAGDLATVGAYREHVSLTPPRELIAQRRGEVIILGFDWPPDVTEVEVAWWSGHGDARRLPVGRAGYDAHGGVRLAAPADETVTIEVAAAGTAQGRRVTGSPVTTVVPGRTAVGYEVRRPRLRGPLTVTLSAAVPVRLRRLVLVTRSGPMPQRPGDGRTVMTWDDVDVPARLEVALPRLARPYWLRCFAEDDTIDLRDPPVRHLKVG